MVHFETVLNFSASPYRKSRYGAIWWASPLLTPIISSATSSQWSPHSADPLAEGLLAATITSGGDESIRRPERTGARRSDHTVLPQVRKGVCRHAEHRSPRRGQAYRSKFRLVRPAERLSSMRFSIFYSRNRSEEERFWGRRTILKDETFCKYFKYTGRRLNSETPQCVPPRLRRAPQRHPPPPPSVGMQHMPAAHRAGGAAAAAPRWFQGPLRQRLQAHGLHSFNL